MSIIRDIVEIKSSQKKKLQTYPTLERHARKISIENIMRQIIVTISNPIS